jgi:hypothetical protein
MDAITIRERATEAIKFWEPMRFVYNGALACIVLLYYWRGLPHSREFANVDGVLFIFILAVLANVAYCAAYPADIFAQLSGFREQWRRLRWILFGIGVLFAGTITRFWCMGLFGVQ